MNNELLIPLISKSLPGIIAQEIVGVQPINPLKPPNFKILTTAIVDGEQWYRVRIYYPKIMDWVNSQNKDWQVEIKDQYPYGRQWDINEKLFMLLSMRWS